MQCKKYLKHKHKPTLTASYNSSMKAGGLEKSKELPKFVVWKKEKFSPTNIHFFGKQMEVKI